MIALVVTLAVVAYMLGQRNNGDTLADVIAGEVDTIEAKAEAKRRLVELDAIQARSWVEERYNEKINRLDAEGQAHVASLRDDPVALAEWLSRIRV